MKMLKRVVVKEELVELTGDMESAIILNQFIYWSERIKDFDKFISEENSRKLENNEDLAPLNEGWIYKDIDELKDEIMFTCSRTTISRKIDKMIKSGWLTKRNNPKFGWDRRYQYRIDLLKIASDLREIGYILQDYKYDTQALNSLNVQNEQCNVQSKETSEICNVQNEQCNIQNEQCNVQNESLIVQNEQAITETTTKTTSEITTNNNKQVVEIDNKEYEELVKMLLSVINNKNNRPLSDKEINIIINHYNGNYKRLRETINYINATQPPEGYKSLVGFFKAALDDAYDVYLPKKTTAPKGSFNHKNKFHNFPSRTEKYTAKQLEDVAKRKRESYRKKKDD